MYARLFPQVGVVSSHWIKRTNRARNYFFALVRCATRCFVFRAFKNTRVSFYNMEKNYVLKISALAFSALSFIFMIVGLTGSKLQTVSSGAIEVEYSARGEAKIDTGSNGYGSGTIDLLDPDLDCYEDTCVARGMALGGIALLSLGLLLHFVLFFSYVKSAFEKGFPICSCMGSGKTITCLGILNALLYLMGVVLAFLALPKLLDASNIEVDPEIADDGYLLIIGFVFSVIPLFLTCFVSKAGSSAETTATATAV